MKFQLDCFVDLKTAATSIPVLTYESKADTPENASNIEKMLTNSWQKLANHVEKRAEISVEPDLDRGVPRQVPGRHGEAHVRDRDPAVDVAAELRAPEERPGGVGSSGIVRRGAPVSRSEKLQMLILERCKSLPLV